MNTYEPKYNTGALKNNHLNSKWWLDKVPASFWASS